MSKDDPVILYLDNTELYGSLKKAITQSLRGEAESVSSKFLDHIKLVQEGSNVVVLTSELAEFESIRNLLTSFPDLSFEKAYSSVVRLRGKYNLPSIDLRKFKTEKLDLGFFRETGLDYKDGLHYSIAKEYDAYIVTGDKNFRKHLEKIYPGRVLSRGEVFRLF